MAGTTVFRFSQLDHNILLQKSLNLSFFPPLTASFPGNQGLCLVVRSDGGACRALLVPLRRRYGRSS